MRNLFKLLILSLILSTLNSCNNSDDNDNIDENPSEPSVIRIVNAFPNLQFNRPVDLQSPDDNTDRIFIVEQSGRISVFPNNNTISNADTFLDIQAIVDDTEDERGLLGLAFHPDYESNGYFYVNYTPFGSLSRISRFQVSPNNPNLADATSELIILEFPQPFINHNGGKIVFGPNDNLLYIASGDGGGAGDPQGNAQNPNNLLGTVLRIDIDRTENGLNYGIPPDNPFVNNQARDEIFAYGLRNPWRISFDIVTGNLWAGDVGQNDFEEIDIIENGNNYGWNILEGNECFNANTCDQNGLTEPVFVYSQNNGASITGGYVYRGESIEQLQGRYVYGDFISGRIWSLDAESTNRDNQLIEDTDLNIASFGTDNSNELYICAFDGFIYTFTE